MHAQSLSNPEKLALRCEAEDARASGQKLGLHVQEDCEVARLHSCFDVSCVRLDRVHVMAGHSTMRRPHKPRCAEIRSLYKYAGMALPGGCLASAGLLRRV